MWFFTWFVSVFGKGEQRTVYGLRIKYTPRPILSFRTWFGFVKSLRVERLIQGSTRTHITTTTFNLKIFTFANINFLKTFFGGEFLPLPSEELYLCLWKELDCCNSQWSLNSSCSCRNYDLNYFNWCLS